MSSARGVESAGVLTRSRRGRRDASGRPSDDVPPARSAAGV